MKQTLLIGLGGTGSRVVNNVAAELRRNEQDINDGIVTCAVLDTNAEDNKLIEKSGTAIPIIPTSKAKIIDEYLAEYSHLDPLQWCPYSTSFGQESMLAGASEMRIKSRIAFMDTIQSREIQKLERVIEGMFTERGDDQIRVMLVSSLSGGTGAGMFIQVALWLRQFFASRNCPSMIRGIFLLPDVFIRTVDSIQKNPRKIQYHYANAYAAIRELNALNKIIQKDYKPERRVVIEGLFDSDEPCLKPVFDFSFFIDDIDQHGVAFKTIGDYEKMAAQIVYMQLYAPMVTEMISVEDNLFRTLNKSSEPLFGACGTAKAVYPMEDVLEYCALRATQEALAEGWNKIDSEIDAMEEDQREDEMNGAVIEHRISRRDEYIKLFDEKAAKTGDQITRGDLLFVRVKRDVFNEKREKTDDGFVDVPTCKVQAFLDMLDDRINGTVSEKGKGEQISRVVADLPDPKNPDAFDSKLVEKLKALREEEKRVIERVLKDFDEKAKGLADEIIRAIMPVDMGSINEKNEEMVYGMLVKKEPEGGRHFVHPVAAKYLLYKLQQEIEARQKTLTVESSRSKAVIGDMTVTFDNPNTRKVETMEKYWEQVGWIVDNKEKAHFIERYQQYNQANKQLCVQYETQLLTQLVLAQLSQRLADLVKQIEKLFQEIGDVIKDVDQDVQKQATKNEAVENIHVYFNAKKQHKEAKYLSLALDISESNPEMNKGVVDAAYGKFCFIYRPNDSDNTEYATVSLGTSLRKQMIESFKAQILRDNRERMDISIYKAVCEESDADFAKEDPSAVETAQARAFRHQQAMRRCVEKIERMASPFLMAQPEASLARGATTPGDDIVTTTDGRKLRMPIQTELMFWGYHPALVKEYDGLEEDLGVNAATSANKQYHRGELCCYRSKYGIKAQAVEKFNEMSKKGDYYTYYDSVINGMISSGCEVDTPHLDKTWHEFLPYVSAEKQKSAVGTFYKAFWQAVAYGVLSLDERKKYQIQRTRINTYGRESFRMEPVMYEGKEIGYTDVDLLLKALKSDAEFEKETTARLQKLYDEDVANMTTYVGTKLMKGLMRGDEMNPVSMISKYNTSRGRNRDLTDDLIASLEEVLRTLPENYDIVRDEQSVERAMYRLCYRIYKESTRTSGKEETFSAWLAVFGDVPNLETTEEETE